MLHKQADPVKLVSENREEVLQEEPEHLEKVLLARKAGPLPPKEGP